MNPIPGAEYAPIIAVIGGRYRQPSEAIEQHFRSVEAILHGVNLKTISGHVRRLSCSDPDDMRAIWRRAALALGATEEEAATAFLRNDLDSWSLVVDRGRGIKPQTRILWTSPQPVWWGRRDVATSALCAHVWGPK